MPTAAPGQFSFNGGELSPSLFGRLDSDRYKASLATCLNFVPMIQGPLDRRPGTIYVAPVKTSSAKTRIVPFQFSTTQTYTLEFGNNYIRFFTNHGQLLNGGGTPLEVVTPYATADIFNLNFTQSGDTLYIAVANYAPRKLLRLGATSWELRTIDFHDGPYLLTGQVQPSPGAGAVVTQNVQLDPGASTGTGISLTATHTTSETVSNADLAADGVSVRIQLAANHGMVDGQQVVIASVGGTTEANGTWFVGIESPTLFYLRGSAFVHAYTSGGSCKPSVFTSVDVGRLVRLKQTNWGYVKITAYTSPQVVTADVYDALDSTAATLNWRLGAWCTLLGYPGCVTFHEDRLSYSGTPQFPSRIDCSVSSNYEKFSPTAKDGTVADNNALSFTLNSNDANFADWLLTDEKGLLCGTTGGEWLIRPGTTQEAMTPTNISAKRTTAWGAVNGLAATLIGKATIFIQRGAKKVRELLFYFDIDGYRATDLTELSEHITGAGITSVSYMKIPYSILWAARTDGALLGMNYERDMQTLKVGWHRHFLGGVSDSASTPPVVESVAVISSPDGTRDELWMVVQRRVNGSTVRYVEYMSKFFEDTDNQQDAHFVDCGGSYDAPITITGGITKANPGVVTAATHGLSNGDVVVIRDVQGMTQLNGNRYTVASAATNTFALHDSSGNNINTAGYGTYISGGTVRKLVSTITGLTWLENETVDVLADGAVYKGLTISNAGVLTLPNPAATIHVGYGYNSDAKLLPLEAGSADGTAMGKTRRTTRVSFMFHRSLGFKFGMGLGSADPVSLDTLNMRTDVVPNNQAPQLFSGLIQETIEADYDFYNQLFMRQDEPLPCRLLAVAVQMQTQDRR